VDTLNNAKPAGATEATVLGPFFTMDAPDGIASARQIPGWIVPLMKSRSITVDQGQSIASEGKGDYLWCEGRVLDTRGNPVSGAIIETCGTDENGLYDTQVRGHTSLVLYRPLTLRFFFRYESVLGEGTP
jgi:protocatechuate 3,4-dioxygenase beta subunit